MLYLQILLLSILVTGIFTQTSTTNLQPHPSQYFQSSAVSLIQNGTFRFDYAITYKTVKTASPTILFSYQSVEYNLNKICIYNNSLLLYVNLYIELYSISGFTAVAITPCPTQINLIKYSYLVIDPAFPYMSGIQFIFVQYLNKNSLFSVNFLYTDPIVAVFLWGINYEVFPSTSTSTEMFGFHWEVNQINSTRSDYIIRSNMVNYAQLKTKAIFLIIYPNLIPSHEYQIENILIQNVGGVLKSYTSSTFSFGKSQMLIGLRNFYLQAVQSTLLDSFKFTVVYEITRLFQLFNSPSLSIISSTVFIINRLQCPSTHPFKKQNTTTLLYECYSSCLSTQFQTYNTSTTVYQCNTCIYPCVKCSSLTVCKSCLTYMELNQLQTCVLKPTYANVTGTIYLCAGLITGCNTCLSTGNKCITCFQGYVLATNQMTCIPCTSIDLQCKTCTLDYCLVCNSGYKMENPIKCIPQNQQPIIPIPLSCDASNCSICDFTKPSICLECVDLQLSLQNGLCLHKCGDGKIMGGEQCDDGNNENLDGCSECKVQQDFYCVSSPLNVSTSKYNTSTCFFNKTVTVTVRRVVKFPTENKLLIYIEVPLILALKWQQVDLSSILSLSGSAASSITSTSVYIDGSFTPNIQKRLLQSAAYNPSDYRYMQVTLQYNETLQHKDLTMILKPSQSNLPVFSSLPSYQTHLSLESDNNLLINHYPESYYATSRTLLMFSQVLGFACLVMMGIGLFVGNMNISLETGFIVQLSYFSLLNVGYLNPFFHALTGLKQSTGFNLPLFYENPLYEATFAKNVVGIGMYTSIANNVNISLVLVVLCLIIGGILKFVSVVVIKEEELKQKLSFIACSSIGSLVFYLVHYSSMLFSVSTSINFMSSGSIAIGYAIAGTCLLLTVLYMGFLYKCNETQFFSKLLEKVKNSKVIYLVVGLIVKLVLGCLIVMMSGNLFGGLVVLGIYLVYLLVVMIKLKPYNYAGMLRFGLSSILSLFIQSIYVYQRFSSSQSQPAQDSINLYLPISIIVMLFLIYLMNLSFFIYSIKQIRCCQLEIEWQKMKDKKIDSDNKKEKKNYQISVGDQVMDENIEKGNQQKVMGKNAGKMHQGYNSAQSRNKDNILYTTENNKDFQCNEDDQDDSSRQLITSPQKLNFLQQNKQVNRFQIQRQIKKQLKSNQINPTNKSFSKKQNNSSLISSTLLRDPNDLYETLNKNYVKNKDMNDELERKNTQKYQYTRQDIFCTYEEYDRI